LSWQNNGFAGERCNFLIKYVSAVLGVPAEKLGIAETESASRRIVDDISVIAEELRCSNL